MPIQTMYNRGMTGQVRVVAILMIVQGALEMLMGLFLLGMAIFMPLMMSQQMAANPAGTNRPLPEEMFWIMSVSYGGMGLAAIVPGILHILAGYRNYQFRNRRFGIVALGMGLVTIATCYCVPTAIGLTIYGLIVYLNEPVAAAFQSVSDGDTVDSVMTRHYQSREQYGR